MTKQYKPPRSAHDDTRWRQDRTRKGGRPTKGAINRFKGYGYRA